MPISDLEGDIGNTVLFTVTFTENDIDWIAEDAGVSLEVARERAHEYAAAIKDQLIQQGNGLLLDAVNGWL